MEWVYVVYVYNCQHFFEISMLLELVPFLTPFFIALAHLKMQKKKYVLVLLIGSYTFFLQL